VAQVEPHREHGGGFSFDGAGICVAVVVHRRVFKVGAWCRRSNIVVYWGALATRDSRTLKIRDSRF